MKTRKIFALFMIVLLIAAFSCSQKEAARDGVMTGEESDKGFAGAPGTTGMVLPEGAPPPSPAPGTTAPSVSPATTESFEQKIIKTADIGIEVKDFGESLTDVRRILKEIAPTDKEGYIASTSSSKSDLGAVSGTVVIRIIPEKFDLLIEKLTAVGDVKNEQITGEDITKEYYDLKGLLTVKEGTERRLLELLATRTNNVADLLEVERELGRVREEINSIKGTLRYYDNLVGKSTVNLTLREPEPILTGIGGFWEPIKGALRDSLEVFGKSIAILIAFLLVVLPWAAAGLVIFYIIRKIVRKSRMKKELAAGAKPKGK